MKTAARLAFLLFILAASMAVSHILTHKLAELIG